MRRIWIVGLAVILLVAVSLSVLSDKPIVRAHGEFWSFVQVGKFSFDIQLTFNVQGRGEEGEGDHGSLSIRYFDPVTGKLVAVVISTDVRDVYIPEEGWIGFWADFRVPKGSSSLPGFRTVECQAYDGGATDEFWITTPGPIPLVIQRGKIVVR